MSVEQIISVVKQFAQSPYVHLTWVFLLIVFLNFARCGTWITAMATGVPLSLGNLMGMRIRRIPAKKIIPAYIKANRAGLLEVSLEDLEAHFVAGGDVEKVVTALVIALRGQVALSFQQACAIDLAGRDILEAVRICVNPRVIDLPLVNAVAQDGVELKIQSKLTVRSNTVNLLGGPGEATVTARVGEGIAAAVGTCERHGTVLENPNYISTLVFNKRLDVGTAIEIVSVDIVNVEMGRNLDAAYKLEQAGAERRISQMDAEARYAMAIAKGEADGQGMGALQRLASAQQGSNYYSASGNENSKMHASLGAGTPLTLD